MFSRVHGHITKVSQRFGPHKTFTHMRTHAQKGVNLTCLCFPCRQEVPGPVHAWTWCPAGVTLGSALKYPIYYFDELPWNFALTRVHREFSFIAGTRSTVSHLMKYLDSSHTFTMKFGADMNGFHLLSPNIRSHQGERNVAGSVLQCEAPYTWTCSPNEDGPAMRNR